MKPLVKDWAVKQSPALMWYCCLWSFDARGVEAMKGSKHIVCDDALVVQVARDLELAPQMPNARDIEAVADAFEGAPVKQVWNLVKWLIRERPANWEKYQWLRERAHARQGQEIR